MLFHDSINLVSTYSLTYNSALLLSIQTLNFSRSDLGSKLPLHLTLNLGSNELCDDFIKSLCNTLAAYDDWNELYINLEDNWMNQRIYLTLRKALSFMARI